MFKNLKIEMVKQNVTAQQIAERLGLKLNTVYKKINDQISVSIDDCQQIQTLFKENNSIDYLFKRDN